MRDPKRSARLAFSVGLAVSAALYLLPPGRYLAYPLVLVSTFVHELGHGIAALLVGADFDSLVLHLDGSGSARVGGSPGRLATATIAFGGVLGPAVAAGLLFPLVARPWLARLGLGLVGAGSLLAGVLVVRSVAGWLTVGCLALVCLAVALRASSVWAQTAVAMVAVQLGLSVFSRADYLFAQVAETSRGQLPSDVAVISEALWLPYWFWGVLCALVSMAVLAVGVRMFWRVTRSGPKSPSDSAVDGSVQVSPAKTATVAGRSRSVQRRASTG